MLPPLICRISVPCLCLIPTGGKGFWLIPSTCFSPFDPSLCSPWTCKYKETSQTAIARLSGELCHNRVGWKADGQLRRLFPRLGFGDKPCGLVPGEKTCPLVEKNLRGIFSQRFPSPELLPVGLNYNRDSSDHCKC